MDDHDARARSAGDASQPVPAEGDEFELRVAARDAIEKTVDWLLSHQHAEGHWRGELEGGPFLESEYILLLAWLGREHSDDAVRASRHLLEQQSPTGGWAHHPGGDMEISASVKAYFALKLTGGSPDDEPMRRARQAILDHGGADVVDGLSRFYLALLGQVDYRHCPAAPPEISLLPSWLPVNIYRLSAWWRTILVPLSIVWSFRPRRELPPEKGIPELFLGAPDDLPDPRRAAVDRWLKRFERWGFKPLRSLAVRRAERWMTRRFAYSDGLGASFSPILWSAIALRCLGYAEDSPEVSYCLQQLEALIVDRGDSIRIQPCLSPVRDTALALRGLAAADVESSAAPLRRAARWLLEKEVTRAGDWAERVRAHPGGWSLQHNNDFYPDIDDTVTAMMALRCQLGPVDFSGLADDRNAAVRTQAASLSHAQAEAAWMERIVGACRRGRQWTLAMQNRDGGWGAFDKDNDRDVLGHIPFAEHQPTTIDPSTPGLTARVLEALAEWGLRSGDEPVQRAVEYLRASQEQDGSWPGRRGVDYIHGVWQVIVGLTAVGVPADDPAIQRGADWLLDHQRADGGWGESPDFDSDSTKRGQGPGTASQTAWALLGLMSAGRHEHAAVDAGVRYLIERQTEEGVWKEPEFTGGGFTQLHLRYHMYPIYFPLLALGEWNRLTRAVATNAPRRAGKRG